MKVKIIGAGSIGNHLAQASQRMGWDVTIVDRDPAALKRTKEEIYPQRYGAWNDKIKLIESKDEPKGGFDVIFLGTPPHVRIPIAIEALKEQPKILQLEKPLCGPHLEGLSDFLKKYRSQKKTIAIMGYDHAISNSINYVVELLDAKKIGKVLTLDVEFREYWGGIFKAHPWLSGPKDSYLGFTAKGGGASGEHSHALHLWQFLAKKAGLGTWKKMAALTQNIDEQGAQFDSIASFTFLTDKNAVGRVIQDVVTSPTKKEARIQGDAGFIEWICNGHERGDVVRFCDTNGKIKEKIFDKKRPDDFYAETLHIKDILDGNVKDSPISFESGLAVMAVLSTLTKNTDSSLVDIDPL